MKRLVLLVLMQIFLFFSSMFGSVFSVLRSGVVLKELHDQNRIRKLAQFFNIQQKFSIVPSGSTVSRDLSLTSRGILCVKKLAAKKIVLVCRVVKQKRYYYLFALLQEYGNSFKIVYYDFFGRMYNQKYPFKVFDIVLRDVTGDGDPEILLFSHYPAAIHDYENDAFAWKFRSQYQDRVVVYQKSGNRYRSLFNYSVFENTIIRFGKDRLWFYYMNKYIHYPEKGYSNLEYNYFMEHIRRLKKYSYKEYRSYFKNRFYLKKLVLFLWDKKRGAFVKRVQIKKLSPFFNK